MNQPPAVDRPDRSRGAAVRRALRARRVRRRVRRGRRRAVAGPGAAAGPRRAGGAGASRRVRGGRRVERRRGRGPAARPVACWSCWPGTRPPARPGIVSLFLPRGRAAERARAGAGRAGPSPRPGCAIVGWRAVPVDPDALGAAAAASRPAVRPGDRRAARARRQATPGPSPTTPSSDGSSSRDAGSRRPPGRREALWPSSRSRPPRRGRSSTRASSSADACPTCIPTCGPPLQSPSRLPPALCHEHPSGLAPGPAVPLIAHNGEINTANTTVVPDPGAENSRALPLMLRRRATTDSANPSFASVLRRRCHPGVGHESPDRRLVLGDRHVSLRHAGVALAPVPAAAKLSPAEQAMVLTVDAEQERTLAMLENWVNQNSGTLNIAGSDQGRRDAPRRARSRWASRSSGST